MKAAIVIFGLLLIGGLLTMWRDVIAFACVYLIVRGLQAVWENHS